ncbi:MAG: transcription-repair coupling factor [Candidatus Saganbacteria bacterium]|nr:transcription-repair coupling factor [Candidatus Saganbacteria bacterium]
MNAGLRPNIEPFIDDLKAGREETFIISKQDSRLKELFIDAGLLKESIRIVHGEIPQGFHLPKEGIALFSDREIFGEHIPRRRFKVQAEKAVPQKFYADYRKGDAVVHKDYGIGIYEGIDKQTVDSVSSDYLYLRFAGDDRLYIPVQQINLISKYNVPGDHIPRLNSLGGSEWRLIKRRAKKSIRDMTKELLETYSSRKSGSGHSFPPDDAWQAELESSFPYEDTPDQTEAVRAVKKDMESDKPMDRLLCADVGYGKTEVALRAAFKAASSGKQVCFLCPTTILAQQHSRLFQARFAPFPFAVEVLSRFKSHSEQKELLKKTESGSIDVIIGTHRLLQNDVKFKDLGLLIIDEEQRFGVAHKEKIKRLKKNVDVLNLSATPIPRTLYMAVSGIWDMSLITTPPPGRSMIETCVLPWRASTVKQAIEKEKERGGQVFYVFNSVEKIGDTAKKLGKILPSISVAVAHGRMKPDELERIMMDFVDGKYDVLLSTTIIESGLDIPNVNTIIIENPDKFGLSTLYQLRGRVGRSNVKAFAYLLYRETSVLTERSLERLQAIKSFTALGSGYRIAMRDLEIRGAGNVLGSQQHGHMLAIGSDLYCDLLKEAAAHFKGEKTPIKHTTLVDLKINAFIPDHFIEDEVERIAVYKRLNLADNFKEVKDLEDELVDRFGHLPLEAVNMLEIVRIKISASSAGIKKITQKNNDLIIELGSEKRLIGIAGSSEKEILSRIEKFVKESDSQVSV